MYSVQRASGIYVCIVYNVHQVCCMYSVQRASGIYVCIMYNMVRWVLCGQVVKVLD